MNKMLAHSLLVLLPWMGAMFAAHGATINVEIRNFYFTPTNIVIQPGDTVVWKNMGFSPHDSTHRAPIGSRLWGSPVLAPNETFSFTFNQPGVFPYMCAIHVANFPQQTGTVSVAAANVAPTVQIVSPANNSALTAPASFTITANANDPDGQVTSVQFFANGLSLGTSGGPQFSVDVSGLAAGSYSLTAVATDDKGAATTSAPVNVSAQNPARHALTLSTSPANGGAVVAEPAMPQDNYPAGTIVAVTATPAQGFTFTGWSGDAAGAQNPLSVTMDTAKSITANFSPIVLPTFALATSVEPAGSGTVEVSPAPNAPGGMYVQGTVVTITAAASANFAFTNWTGDVSTSANPVTLTIEGPRAVIAHFKESAVPSFLLTTATDPQNGGLIEANPAPNGANGTYLQGTVVTLTATAATNFAFANWSGNASGTESSVTVTTDAPKTVTAHFIAVALPTFALATTVAPLNAGVIRISPAPNASGGRYVQGTVVTVTATPATNFAFSAWSGASSSSSVSITLTVDAEKTLVANFIVATPPTRALTLAVSPTGAGNVIVTPPSSNNIYASGTLLALAAQPAAGFRFAGWSGAVVSTNNPIPLAMDSDKSLTALFEPASGVEFSKARGAYGGLIEDATGTNYTQSGFVTLRVSQSGGFRGSAVIGGMRAALAGQFDRFGYAPLVARGASLTGSLQIEGDSIRGSILDPATGAQSELLLYARKPPPTNTSFAGNYAVALPAQEPVSEPGMIELTVRPDGITRIRGRLGDGSLIRQRSFVSADGRIPVFTLLYHGRGLAQGWLEIGAAVTGTLSWFRPADSRSSEFPEGFALEFPASGSRQ